MVHLDIALAVVLAAPGETEPGHAVDRLDGLFFVFRVVTLHLLEDATSPLHGGTNRQLHLTEHEAGIVLGQKSRRQARKQDGDARDNGAVNNQITDRSAQHSRHQTLVSGRAALKGSVEPAKKAALIFVVAGCYGFEHAGTERGRQNQGHEHR